MSWTKELYVLIMDEGLTAEEAMNVIFKRRLEAHEQRKIEANLSGGSTTGETRTEHRSTDGIQQID